MKIGLVGKPSSGKSTFFNAETLQNAEIAEYPFTTIKPNTGTGYVSVPCVCQEFKVKCNPQNSACENGIRLIPIQMIDVAGLVPDAHLGKGLGNQFLNDLTEAEALIHTVDLSGKTNEKGEGCEKHNPEKDILFLENEIDMWLKNILEKNWKNIERKEKSGAKLHEIIYEQLSGFKLEKELIKKIIKSGYDNLLDLAKKIRTENKPVVLAGNKIDRGDAKENFEELKEKYDIVPTSSDAELVLRRADKAGLIKYTPGNKDFEILKEMKPEQKVALEKIKINVLDVYSSTGVQKVINKTVFEKLNLIEVYPVEDEKKLMNKQGQILPDVFLVKKGATALDLAEKVHTDIAKNFKGALDARTKQKLGKDYQLKKGDVVKILI